MYTCRGKDSGTIMDKILGTNLQNIGALFT